MIHFPVLVLNISKEVKIYQNMDKYREGRTVNMWLTIFPWVPNFGVRIWSLPNIIDGLHFYVKGGEGANIWDNEGWRTGVIMVPLWPLTNCTSPHHPVLEARAIEGLWVHLLQSRAQRSLLGPEGYKSNRQGTDPLKYSQMNFMTNIFR